VRRKSRATQWSAPSTLEGSDKSITLQDGDTAAAALTRFIAKPSLGFSDCLVLETARKAGHLPLGSLDRNLSKLEGGERLHA
jgi:predicted nucleic acid-binding protein